MNDEIISGLIATADNLATMLIGCAVTEAAMTIAMVRLHLLADGAARRRRQATRWGNMRPGDDHYASK